MNDAEIAALVTHYVEGELDAKGMARRLEAGERLISSGLLSSVDVLGLVALLEDRFAVEIEAHEISPDSMDSIPAIVALVQGKRAGSSGGGASGAAGPDAPGDRDPAGDLDR